MGITRKPKKRKKENHGFPRFFLQREQKIKNIRRKRTTIFKNPYKPKLRCGAYLIEKKMMIPL